MQFGGLAPLPGRLGPSSDESISPENWLRICDDVVMQRQPLAVLLIAEGAGVGACTVTGVSMGGMDVSGITATLYESSPGEWTTLINLGEGYTSPLDGSVVKWSPRYTHAKVVGSTMAITETTAGQYVTLSYSDLRSWPFSYTVVIYGWTAQKWAGDYGAEPTKKAAKKENDAPYAWVWLQEMQVVRGDAFSTASDSPTQWENIAIARIYAYLQSIAERHAACQLPMQADQNLGRWATIMNIGTTDDRDWQVRRKCAAKFALTTTGASETSMNAAASLLFGSNFTSITWGEGTIDAPPPNTFWPGGTAGPGDYDLGGGPWLSSRYSFVVALNTANDAETVRVRNLALRDFDEMLRAALPPVTTWAYQFNSGSGFTLDFSRMDYEAL